MGRRVEVAENCDPRCFHQPSGQNSAIQTAPQALRVFIATKLVEGELHGKLVREESVCYAGHWPVSKFINASLDSYE